MIDKNQLWNKITYAQMSVKQKTTYLVLLDSAILRIELLNHTDPSGIFAPFCSKAVVAYLP